MQNRKTLMSNLEKIHTTEMGVDRIKNNINLAIDDVVSWCKDKISSPNSEIIRRGKNYYIEVDNFIITVNSYSYTIITAHTKKTLKPK